MRGKCQEDDVVYEDAQSVLIMWVLIRCRTGRVYRVLIGVSLRKFVCSCNNEKMHGYTHTHTHLQSNLACFGVTCYFSWCEIMHSSQLGMHLLIQVFVCVTVTELARL